MLLKRYEAWQGQGKSDRALLDFSLGLFLGMPQAKPLHAPVPFSPSLACAIIPGCAEASCLLACSISLGVNEPEAEALSIFINGQGSLQKKVFGKE